MSDFTWLVTAFLAFLTFAQAVIWLNNTFFGLRRKVKLQNRPPLIGLVGHGFFPVLNVCVDYGGRTSFVNEVGYVGLVNTYAVEIFFEYKTGWLIHPHFTIRAYFNPYCANSDGSDLTKYIEKTVKSSVLFKKENSTLAVTHAQTQLFIGKYWWPKTHHLLAAAQELTLELIKANLLPIEYENGLNITRNITNI